MIQNLLLTKKNTSVYQAIFISMEKIKISEHLFAIIDKEDLELLSQYKWRPKIRKGKLECVETTIKEKDKVRVLKMHHIVFGDVEKGVVVDHINHNPADNRKSNLRFCSVAENVRNSGKKSTNSSGYCGIDRPKGRRKWRVQLSINYKRVFGGYYSSAREAALVYDMLCYQFHHEYSCTNFGTKNSKFNFIRFL